MKTFLAVGLLITAAGASWAVEPAVHQNGPLIKNLMAPTYRAPAAPAALSHELTSREAKKLTATAESAADHGRLARYYAAEANRLDAQGAAYEQAATSYRRGPHVKNLMAPSTAARYEYFAKGFRAEAKSDRELAVAHEQMAKKATASL